MFVFAPELLLTPDERAVFDKHGSDTAETLIDGMCLWEAVIGLEAVAYAKIKSQPGFDRYDHTTHDLSVLTPFQKNVYGMREAVGGSFALRDRVTGWVPTLQLAWAIAHEVYDYDESFDFEFCPWFLEHCIDYETVVVRPDWLLQVRNIHEIIYQSRMDAEGWFVTDEYRLERRDDLRAFEDDYGAWRHVLERAIENRNPIHRRALREVRANNPQEFNRLSDFCRGAFNVRLDAELDRFNW